MAAGGVASLMNQVRAIFWKVIYGLSAYGGAVTTDSQESASLKQANLLPAHRALKLQPTRKSRLH